MTNQKMKCYSPSSTCLTYLLYNLLLVIYIQGTYHKVEGVKHLKPNPIPKLNHASFIQSSYKTIRGGGTGSTIQKDDDDDDAVEMKSKGGGPSSNKKKKSKKRHHNLTNEHDAIKSSISKKKKKKSAIAKDVEKDKSELEGKTIINTAMKEKDFPTAMGDAIRERSDILLNDIPKPSHDDDPIDATLSSISYALGTSSYTKGLEQSTIKQTADDYEYDDFAGGVEPSVSAILANYFLKTHGGTHAMQSICSLLSVLFSIPILFLPSSPMTPFLSPSSSQGGNKSTITNTATVTTTLQQQQKLQSYLSIQLTCMKRTCQFALMKHLSGFLAFSTLTASQFTNRMIRWNDLRRRLEGMVLDPIAQYLFYCGLLIVWFSSVDLFSKDGNKSQFDNIGRQIQILMSNEGTSIGSTTGSSKIVTIPWWLMNKRSKLIEICFVGPILLREVISVLWVISDVLVLIHSTGRSQTLFIVQTFKKVTDAIMSIIFTADTWHNADSLKRQKLLAKLIGKLSLGLEVITGCIISYDALLTLFAFSFRPMKERPSFWNVVLTRLFCARLYLNFMLVRRQKIRDLVLGAIRGGATYAPGRVLDVLLEPSKTLGLDVVHCEEETSNCAEEEHMSKFDYLLYLLGFS